jgi:hypothetical protein
VLVMVPLILNIGYRIDPISAKFILE